MDHIERYQRATEAEATMLDYVVYGIAGTATAAVLIVFASLPELLQLLLP